MVKRALIACRTGMGSSMMLKIKVDQVVRAKGFPLEVQHSTLDDVKSFKGDLLITMADVADELKGQVPYIIGINNLMDKKEIETKLQAFFDSQD
ncbi:PTS sugar transporter subunit IIB [Enterococcus hulanensis]|uniref:PTS sugar transporter subunit IIB n=1 Tax=Enterococcus hulanensis TaxID=2559929 RepID=A0ABU3EXL6_9ENTE|nr:PTS sugar transporter subunit IIB [Enterococcus hulanensis]MDT2599595.1 PTS sugar transporter subunit IIB [Enterococcus hulanensis]MDT2609549.1 PTS sugar transporter subunit IIB [Enterococcus hulanensis]MDT2616126.1 PTS sugar transporter subunit IIB [Enterococcus hulanensis]MDT2627834.1 PTS sugar transporter subunit IIB [Enterococcus hulanensis]MDT2654939.1 PTS sugar transporter subunit IIB [Enterococcus hulanensis]